MTRKRRGVTRAAPALLDELARALSACERAGLAVKFRHGIACTREGYVVPLDDGQWVARTLVWTEFSGADDSGGG